MSNGPGHEVNRRLGVLCDEWEAEAGRGWGVDLSDYGEEFVAGFVAGGEHARDVRAAAVADASERGEAP